eukprot:TRINITY_DN6354_c0_g1_i2.p1 TRINITY_DN6354_c0_g1~~TRINITY_DN6354_c0_g1_i2.p1  ORF type:complete len:792 (-),score=209.84 TRINITY_DN6354_c0_g1_i2:309-2684(-)
MPRKKKGKNQSEPSDPTSPPIEPSQLSHSAPMSTSVRQSTSVDVMSTSVSPPSTKKTAWSRGGGRLLAQALHGITPATRRDDDLLSSQGPDRRSKEEVEEYVERPSPSTEMGARRRMIQLANDDEVGNLAKKPIASVTQKPGRPITIFTNHFLFEAKQQTIYQYMVDFWPEVEKKGLKRKLLEEHRDVLGAFTFDGAMLFLQKQIGDIELIQKASAEGQQPIRIGIKFTNEISKAAPLQLYNTTLKNILRLLKLKLIGRNYFDPSRSIRIERHDVELWPGYFTAINPNDRGIALVADVAHKVLRTDTVLDFLHRLQGTLHRGWKDMVHQQLIGQIVLTRYNNRTYRIDDLAWDMNPHSTFQKRSGEQMSYQKYYSLSYGKNISVMDQPLLVHRHKTKGRPDEIIYLIPELCSMTGITDDMRADFHVMQDISHHTRVPPDVRADELQKFIANTTRNPEVAKELAQWGFQISSEMMQVPGRVFAPETIIFGKNKRVTVNPETEEWSNVSKQSHVLSSNPLKLWILVHTYKNRALAQDFAFNVGKAGSAIGFSIGPPQFLELKDDRKNSFLEVIKRGVSKETEFVAVILPNSQADRYDGIKQICCLELPVPSQCILAKNLSNPKKVMSVCQNIIRQINCKMGGELWMVDVPLKKAMIIGVDVYHDTLTKGQSVCGFSASMNQTFTKYFTPVCFQKTGQELVDGLGECMRQALQQYFILNKYLPDLILVYRDGVGDGMLHAIVDHEIPQLLDTFRKFSENYKPHVTVVVVKKKNPHSNVCENFRKTPKSSARKHH